MRRGALEIIARWLHTLCLSLWLGGLVAIGALVAPTAFQIVRLNPALAGQPALQATLAGGIVGGSLRLFNDLCYAAGALLLVADILLLTRGGLPPAGRLWTRVSLAVTVILFGSLLYQGLHLFPAMDMAQGQNNRTLFDSLHARYEGISTGLQLPLLLILTLLTALRDRAGVAPAPPAAVTEAPGAVSQRGC